MKKLIAAAAAIVVLGGTGVAGADPDPNGPAKRGLCTAYFNGSEKGQEKKHRAGPFAGLETAAEENDQTVEEFCAGLVGGRAGRDG